MFRTAYDTTACQRHPIQNIINAILQHRAMGGDQIRIAKNPLTDNYIYSVKVIINGHGVIPPFGHPIPIDDKTLYANNQFDNGFKSNTVFVDARNFTKTNMNPGASDSSDGYEVKALLDFHFACTRGFLQQVWLKYNPRDLLTIGNYQIMIYARWLSGVLTRRFALPPETQMNLTIICAYFYLCMFMDDNTVADEEFRLRCAKQISSCTYINAEDCLVVLDQLPYLPNVQALVDALKMQSGTVRLEEMSIALLYQITAGSWFGPNNVEVTHVALEHPPTFIAMIVSAANEKGYKNTAIGRLVDQYDGDDELKPFLLNIKRLQRDE